MKNAIKSMTPEQVVKVMQHLKGKRGTWESQWQEIADLILPRKNDITVKRSEGSKRNSEILDNSGLTACELLAGALHGLLTNPDSPWFEYTTGDLKLDNDDQVRRWLQDAGRRTHNVFNNSNFQTEVHELYLDLAGLCTGCMRIEEDPEMVVRFSTQFIRDYLVDENHLGFIDRIYREWSWPAEKVVAEFGQDNVHKDVLKAYQDGDAVKEFKVVHAVYPATMADPGTNSTKYVSHSFLKDLKYDMRVSSFDSFPYVVPRWGKAAGEIYGRGPGINALPEIRILNKMAETMLIGAQKMVDPPLQLPDDGYILPIITRPGGLNFYRPNGGEIIRPIFNNTNVDFGYQAMEDRRRRVRDAFYVDQLQLQAPGGPMMTATEVQQRTQEKMRLLGPMLGRMLSEFLRPMVDRVFAIMWKRQMFGPPPPALHGKKVDVRYSSFIAKAQRMGEGQNISQFLQALVPFIQLDPSVADNLDGDRAARVIAGIYGAPQEIIKDFDAVVQVRQQKAQAAKQQADQQAMMAQAQAGGQITDAAAKVGGLNGQPGEGQAQ